MGDPSRTCRTLVARRSSANPGRVSGRRRLWRSRAILGLSPDCHLLQGQHAQQPQRGPATCELRYHAELARFVHTQNRIFIYRHHSEPLPVSKACSFWLQILFCRTRRVRGVHNWGRGCVSRQEFPYRAVKISAVARASEILDTHEYRSAIQTDKNAAIPRRPGFDPGEPRRHRGLFTSIHWVLVGNTEGRAEN